MTQLLAASIMFDDFEWDPVKARTNLAKHKVSFEQATAVFADPFASVEFDDSEAYGEDRYVMTGAVRTVILTVVYTERSEKYRIISAREATNYERRDYFRAAQQD